MSSTYRVELLLAVCGAVAVHGNLYVSDVCDTIKICDFHQHVNGQARTVSKPKQPIYSCEKIIIYSHVCLSLKSTDVSHVNKFNSEFSHRRMTPTSTADVN